MENNKLNLKDKNGFFSKLSRTLYIGNLDKNVNDATLYKYFGEFGDIISINIKKEGCVSNKSLKVYAFIKYFDTSSVVLAMLKMNGIEMEGCKLRLGFGKSYPSKCVWITGIKQLEDNNLLLTFLADCGPIITCSFDEINKRAIVYFKEIVNAETAINKLKDGFLNGLYFYGDYASTECQAKFAEFFNKLNHKNCLSINLDKIDSQNSSISNVNKQKSARRRNDEAVKSWIASMEIKSQITCIWVDGIADSVTNEYLESHFSQFGPIRKCLIDRFNKYALLCFQEELHAQPAVTGMNGSYIEGKLVHVHLAYIKCRGCKVSNINNDNLTIQQQDNTGQLLPYGERHVDPYCKCTISVETCPINIRDPRNNSIYVNNAQNISQHKYLNICNINIPNDSSNANLNDSSITIIFNEYPSKSLKSPIQFPGFDVLSLPMPEFAKNISKKLTITSPRYSLSSNTGVDQEYTFNVHHDDKINYGSEKTEKWNHSLKYNYKNLNSLKSVESATEKQSLFFEEINRPQDVSYKHTPKEFIQSQSSLKLQDQQLSSSFITHSSSDSSKYGLDLLASTIESQYYVQNDTKPKIIPQNSKTPLKDSQILPFDTNGLIDHKCPSSRMISENIYTTSNNMQTSGGINTDFIYSMPENEIRYNKFLGVVPTIQDEDTKHWATTSNWLTNTPNYDCAEKLNHWRLSDTSEKEKEDQSKEINKQKSLDVFVAKNSIEHVRPIFVDVEKSPNIDEENTDNTAYEKSIANILLSLNENIKNKIVSIETKDKIEKINCNESASSISNIENNKKNESVYYNHVKINDYEDNESQNIPSISSMECKSHNIKSNMIQGEDEKTNGDEYNTKYLNIKETEERKNPILYSDHHEKENKHCKPKTVLDSKSIKSKSNKCTIFGLDMFKINQTTNKKKERLISNETENIKKNKDHKFGKGFASIEEENQNLDIHNNYKNSRKDNRYKNDIDVYQKYSCFNFNIKDDNKFKNYTKKVDRNIASNYCSTANSLKRMISDLSKNHNHSKRWKADNKARGWINGYSISEILSSEKKISTSNKVKS